MLIDPGAYLPPIHVREPSGSPFTLFNVSCVDRSIYPDEFANFAERIQEQCRLVTERIPVREAHENEALTRDTVLEVDMVQPMIDGVVDPELRGKLDRDK